MGSSSSTDRVVVGRVGRPHGIAGHVVVHSESDDPERFRPGSELLTSDGRQLVVAEVARSPGPLLVRFEGVPDRDAAEALRGTSLTIPPEARRPLGQDEFWPDELVGLEARNEAGGVLGTVVAVVEGPAQERLVVESPDGRRAEVPFVADLVPEVDVQAGYLVIASIEGLV